VSIHYFRFDLHETVDRQRSPLLESLLARADAVREIGNWRADAFRLLAPRAQTMPDIGAAAWAGQGGAAATEDGTAGDTVYMATPVHYVAEMSNVRLPVDGLLTLERRDAQKLTADFNRVWHGAGVRLALGRHSELFCIMHHSPAATTHDPGDARGRHIENFLPTGEGAPRVRQLMSEIEMWLFEHEVNRDRGARAAPVVTGLWLWGGGAALTSQPRLEAWTAGNDPFFAGTAATAASAASPLTLPPLSARPPLPQSPAGSGVAVFFAQPGSAEWRDMELNWLRPSLRGLRSGRVQRVDLSAHHRCFSIGAAWRRRFWRRPRPWWESFP
jgi:hypothetical protein